MTELIMSTRKFSSQGENLPQWSNPISRAVVVGKQCFVSAQHSSRLCPGIYSTGSNSSNNFIAAVKAADFTKQEIVFVDIAFIDLGDADVVNALYGNLLAEGLRPARTIYEVTALPLDGKIKVMSTVAKD